jgi:outer membrane protein
MNKLMFLLGMIFFSGTVLAKVTVGVVDIQTIITSVKEGKAVMTTLQKSFDEKKNKLQKEEDKIKKMQESFEKQSLVLSDDVKAKKQQEIQQMVMKLREQTMEYQKNIQQQENDLKKPILDKLKDVIEAVSKEQKVDFTVEISSSPLVYAENKKDLTPLVIQEYDKKHGKK